MQGGDNKSKKILLIISIVLLILAVFTFIVQSLWNFVVPDLFNGPEIEFFQAMALLLLAKILFGGFRPWKSSGKSWKEKWMHKSSALSDEQRSRMKEKFFMYCDKKKKSTEVVDSQTTDNSSSSEEDNITK